MPEPSKEITYVRVALRDKDAPILAELHALLKIWNASEIVRIALRALLAETRAARKAARR